MPPSADAAPPVAIVTGAGRGIGQGVCRGLAAAGWRVAGASRTAADLDRTVELIGSGGGTAIGVPTDVCSPDDCTRLASEVIERYGRIDLVVASAGAAADPSSTVAERAATFRELFETNVLGVLNIVQATAPLMTEAGGGRVLVMGSGTGHSATAGLGAYGVSKAAVSMLVRVLALELRSARVAVNEIVPGPVRTPMTGYSAEGEPSSSANEDRWRAIGEWIKDPADVAELVVYLASLPPDGPTGQAFSLAGRLL